MDIREGFEISAGIIIYRRTKEGPKFLLLYSGGMYWNFPKGKLAEGEKNFKAALREVEEETGVNPRDLQFRNRFRVEDRFTYVRNRQKIHKTVTYYLAETRKADIRLNMVPADHQGERHEGYGWFLLRDALKVVRAPNLKRHMKRAYDAIVHQKSSRPREKDSPRTGNDVRGSRPAAS